MEEFLPNANHNGGIIESQNHDWDSFRSCLSNQEEEKPNSIPERTIPSSSNQEVKEKEEPIAVTPTGRTTSKKIYNDGSIYEGECSNDGKWNGRGTLRTQWGDIIEGEKFINGKVHGKVTVRSHNGNVYEGEYDLKEHTPQRGLGKKHSRGGSYSGSGKLTKPNGATYEGEFVEGKLNGRGKITYARSPCGGTQTYEGGIVADKCTGHGRMTWPNGDSYEGDFKDGRRTGHGKLTWVATSTVYEGGFITGMFNGYGKLSQASIGVIYEGNFQDNVYHGFGKGYFADGSSYEGMWKNIEFHGQGKKTLSTGEIYSINFNHGKMQGKGTIRFPNGKLEEGKWENDERVYSRKDNLKAIAKKGKAVGSSFATGAAQVSSKVVSKIRKAPHKMRASMYK